MSQDNAALHPGSAVSAQCTHGSLTLLAMLLIALASLYSEYRREETQGFGAGSGYRVALGLLILLTAVVPILAFIAVRQSNQMWLSPTEIIVGRRRVAWTDIGEATWEGYRGVNWLLLHSTSGPPLRVLPSTYDGGEEKVLSLLQEYLPNHVLGAATAEMRESE